MRNTYKVRVIETVVFTYEKTVEAQSDFEAEQHVLNMVNDGTLKAELPEGDRFEVETRSEKVSN